MARNTSITLGDHFHTFVHDLVDSGRYGSTSDVIRAGLRMVGTRAFRVETPEESKAMLMGVLQGDQGPARDIVCLNSGAALYAANVAGSIEEGLERAQKAIDSGAALAKLQELVAYSQKLGQAAA